MLHFEVFFPVLMPCLGKLPFLCGSNEESIWCPCVGERLAAMGWVIIGG